jgi:hypothetical protein
LGSTAPESDQHALYGGLKIPADAFALAGGRLGERDAGVRDHPDHDLGHRIGRNVIGVDAGLNTAQQQLARRL